MTIIGLEEYGDYEDYRIMGIWGIMRIVDHEIIGL